MDSAPIPVIHSIPSGKALIENVLCHYPIGIALSCRLYKRGLNDTYLVETEQDRYILRLYRRGWRTKQQIDFELELLEFLRDRNVPVAYPIESKNGGFTVAVTAPEGKRYAAVFSYAPGNAANEKLNQAIRPLSAAELAAIPVFTKVAHIWVMGINCQAAGEVIPYGHFTDEWFDAKLALLTQLDREEFDLN